MKSGSKNSSKSSESPSPPKSPIFGKFDLSKLSPKKKKNKGLPHYQSPYSKKQINQELIKIKIKSNGVNKLYAINPKKPIQQIVKELLFQDKQLYEMSEQKLREQILRQMKISIERENSLKKQQQLKSKAPPKKQQSSSSDEQVMYELQPKDILPLTILFKHLLQDQNSRYLSFQQNRLKSLKKILSEEHYNTIHKMFLIFLHRQQKIKLDDFICLCCQQNYVRVVYQIFNN